LPWVIAGAVLALSDRVVMAHRWYLMLGHRARVAIGFRAVLAASLRASFLGTFIPTGLGTELIRILSFRRDGVDGFHATAAVMIDRYLGVVSTLLMGLVGVALAPDLGDDPLVRTALIAVAGASALGGTAIFHRRARASVFRMSARLRPESWRHHIRRIVAAIAQYQRRPATLGVVLLESMGVQLLRIGAAATVGRGLGLELTFITYLALVPLALLVLMLPISLSGLGTVHASFILFFERVDVSRADAFTLATILLFIGLLSALPGGFLLGRPRARHVYLNGGSTG
jgi:hypothetical protein